MAPLFLASHPALDFLNTRFGPQDRAIERIGDGQSFLAWLMDAGLLEAPTASKLRRRFGAQDLDAAAAEARTLREWAGAWIAGWRGAPRGNHGAELRRLNRLLERAKSYPELTAARGGMQIVERHRIDSADQLIALVAREIASLVATEQPALVKRCAGADCTLWFLDRTKSHARLFCSAAVCGNRAKVAAFRQRQRIDSA